jgi:hypothetical protein
MANVKVKFLMTAAGAYGIAQAGDEVTVSDADAKQLEKNGTARIVGDSKDEVTTPSSGSVRFSEEKAQGPSGEADTNPKDATGKAAAKKGAAKKTAAKKTSKQ